LGSFLFSYQFRLPGQGPEGTGEEESVHLIYTIIVGLGLLFILVQISPIGIASRQPQSLAILHRSTF